MFKKENKSKELEKKVYMKLKQKRKVITKKYGVKVDFWWKTVAAKRQINMWIHG